MSRVGSAAASGVIATSAALLGNRLAVEKLSPSAWTRRNHAGATVTLAEGPVALLAMLAGLLVPGRAVPPRYAGPSHSRLPDRVRSGRMTIFAGRARQRDSAVTLPRSALARSRAGR